MQDFTHVLPDNESTKKFILAGNATFTVRNEESGNRFTYKVKQGTRNPNIYFISVLTRPDNDSDDSYTYLGAYSKQKGYIHSPKSHISPTAVSAKVVAWYFKWLFLDKLPEYIKTYHEGRCGRCGRKLTVPESVLSGFGEECLSIIIKTESYEKHY